MPPAGLEPARCYPLDFESSASANSATVAYAFARKISYHTLETDARSFCKSTWKNALDSVEEAKAKIKECHVDEKRFVLSNALYKNAKKQEIL